MCIGSGARLDWRHGALVTCYSRLRRPIGEERPRAVGRQCRRRGGRWGSSGGKLCGSATWRAYLAFLPGCTVHGPGVGLCCLQVCLVTRYLRLSSVGMADMVVKCVHLKYVHVSWVDCLATCTSSPSLVRSILVRTRNSKAELHHLMFSASMHAISISLSCHWRMFSICSGVKKDSGPTVSMDSLGQQARNFTSASTS